MVIKVGVLLLAGSSLVHAGIFQRQCVPSTITVTSAAPTCYQSGAAPATDSPNEITTVSPDTAAQTTTVQLTSTFTLTVTATESVVPIRTVTSTLTNLITVHATSTLTQTVTDLALVPPTTAAVIPAGEAQTPTQNALTGLNIASYGELSSPPTKSLRTTTVLVVPVPFTDSSEQPITTVVPVTTISYLTSSFPTLSVTGNIGVTPSTHTVTTTGGSNGLSTSTALRTKPSTPPISGLQSATSLAPAPFTNPTRPVIASSGFASSPGASIRPSLTRRGLQHERRQVGSIVTATIDGVVVTWTNTWNGGVPASTTVPPSTPSQASTVVVTATVDGAVVTWTQVIAASEPKTATSTSTLATRPPGGPVTIGDSSSGELTTEIPTTTSLSTSVGTVASDGPWYTPPAWLTSQFPIVPVSSAAATGNPASPSTASSAAATQTGIQVTITNPSTLSISSAASTVSISTPSATCTGRFSGNFTINFDDLPRNGEPPSSEQYPPFRNPYYNLYWSQGFSYAPPPSDPYLPRSAPQLGVFVVDGDANIHSQNWTGPIPHDMDVNGMFGAGPNFANPTFYIDAYSAWVGCQNNGSAECQFQVNGYALDAPSGNLALQVEQYFYQEPCAGNCPLLEIQLSPAFRNLTALQIQASYQGDNTTTSLTWYIDDIALGWSDNSCGAVQARGKTGSSGIPGAFVKHKRGSSSRDSISWQSRVPVMPAGSRQLR